GQTCGRSLEPSVHAEGMLAVVKHGAAGSDAADTPDAVTLAGANDSPFCSLTPSSNPLASESAVPPGHQKLWLGRAASRSPTRYARTCTSRTSGSSDDGGGFSATSR